MHQHHSHAGHDHGHAHGPADYNRAFAIGVALNAGFVVVEAVYGFLAHSLALLADAGHNLSDVLGLLLAWGALYLSSREPTEHHTYGLRRSSILAALANAIILLIAIGAIALESIDRFRTPAPIAGTTVSVVAGIGILVNGVTALLFLSGRKHDINLQGAFVHMAADAALSLGVLITGLVIARTSWYWLDPTVSLILVITIAYGTWDLLRRSFDLAMDAVPSHIDPTAVRAYLASLPGITAVHDLHIWGMSTTETALTVHLVRPSAPTAGPCDDLLHRAAHDLEDRFHIHHVTIQIEQGDPRYPCHQEPEHVV